MEDQGNQNAAGTRSLLRFLQRRSLIEATDVSRLEAAAAAQQLTIQEVLAREEIITEKDLADLLAASLRLPRGNPDSLAPDPRVAQCLREAMALRLCIAPIRATEAEIEVMTANPLDLAALRSVEFSSGRRVRPAVGTVAEVREAFGHIYRLEEALDQLLQGMGNEDEITVTELRGDATELRDAIRDADLPPVVKLSDLIIAEGIKTGASDIHVEPTPDGTVVRYRLDGMLHESFHFPKWVQAPLIARLKVTAKLDITERRAPQDGRIQVRYSDRRIDLRVSSLPTQHGEKITMRILDAARGIKPLSQIGFSPADEEHVRSAISRPEGMVLVTGPTGSGKTTTLYALIREILSPDINVVTIENPIEYQIKSINQVEVNEKQGLTFASALRSVLRQDPDVILVGEIRDAETARIAFQAAQTGHLVLSTLHTNDAVATVTRLLDLGVEPYAIGAALQLIIAQRLVRRVCPACSAPYQVADESRRLLRLDDYRREFRRGQGCPRCQQTGYLGRLGVFEMLPISPALAGLIEGGGSQAAIRQQGRSDGSTTLLEDALLKLSEGVTTAEEVLRVVQVNANAPQCPACNREVEDSFSTCPHCSQGLREICDSCGKPMTSDWVTCPYCDGKTSQSSGGAALAAAPSAPSPPAPPALQRTFKALVVDDDADLRRIVRMTLENAGLGLSVFTAQDGIEALSLVDIERPDIAVLDLNMPGIDGAEVCRRLRADARTKAIPILMLTGREGDNEITGAFHAGVDDYLLKPLRPAELVARVRRMIQRTFGEPPADATGVAA